MRKEKLLSTVAMALLLSAGAAWAQGAGKDTPERAPAAQQNAPAEKVAPPMKQGGQSSSQTTGQGTPDGKANGGKTDKMDGSGKPDSRSRTEQSGSSSKATEGTTEQNRTTTTGQGAAAGSARLSTEQRTKITSIIRQHKVEPAKLSISVTVGTRVPESVHLHPLPVQVVEIYPEWRGFDYILVGSQIVVINPRTHEIVAILEA